MSSPTYVGYFIFRLFKEVLEWFKDSKRRRLQREAELRTFVEEQRRLKAEAEAEARENQRLKTELFGNMAAWREQSDVHLAEKARTTLREQAQKRY